MAPIKSIPTTKPPMGTRSWDQLDPEGEEIWQAKLDGAFIYYTLDKDGIRAFSYRRSKRDGKPIEHTQKLFGVQDAEVPPEYHGVILSGEAFHPNLAAREVGGILNTRRNSTGESLHPALHGIVKMPGVDVHKLDNFQKMDLMRGIANEFPFFELPETAETPEEKQVMAEKIQAGKHDQTREGVVIYPQNGPPMKAAIEPTFDLPAVGVTPGAGRHAGSGIGAILVGTPENPTRVGTGLSDSLRQALYQDPKLIDGLVLKVKAKERFPSGKLRAPALVEIHPEKSDLEKLQKLDDIMLKKAGDSGYSEGKSSTFTHDYMGTRRVDDLIRATKDHPIKNMNPKTLEWVFKHSPPEPGRTRKADPSVPVIVARFKGGYAILDGDHRTAKALELGMNKIPVKVISNQELRAIPKTDKQGNYLNKLARAQEEFAPGIPSERDIKEIRDTLNDEWELCVQCHDAERAGRHYDLRLGDPQTGHAHSWALPKAVLPDDENRIRLAVQQPTHTREYMDFEGEIPEGYGAGKVQLVHRGKVPVRVEPGKIHFSVPDKGDMVLIKREGNSWMLIKKRTEKTAQNQYQHAGQMNYRRPNYAALGEHKLRGGTYDSATAAGIAGMGMGTAHQAIQTSGANKKIRASANRARARIKTNPKNYRAGTPTSSTAVAAYDPEFAKRQSMSSSSKVYGGESGRLSSRAKKGLSRINRREIALRGKAFMRHLPKSLATAAVAAGGTHLLSSLWNRAKSGRYGGVRTGSRRHREYKTVHAHVVNGFRDKIAKARWAKQPLDTLKKLWHKTTARERGHVFGPRGESIRGATSAKWKKLETSGGRKDYISALRSRKKDRILGESGYGGSVAAARRLYDSGRSPRVFIDRAKKKGIGASSVFDDARKGMREKAVQESAHKKLVSEQHKAWKTANASLMAGFGDKFAAFSGRNKLPQLNTRLSPFRSDMKAKLKPPFKIEAPAVNVIRTGKSSTGKIEGTPVQGNPVRTVSSPGGGRASV